MTHSYSPQDNPALSAANLLQRMGFLTLLSLLPFFSTISVRAGVVLLPTAFCFFIISSIFSQTKPDFRSLKHIIFSIPALSGMVILLLALISILWTTAPDQALRRYIDILYTLFLLLAGYSLMPDRVRASHVNLLPVGMFFAAISLLISLISFKLSSFTEWSPEFRRGLQIYLLFLWPTLTWLLFRNHYKSACFFIVVSSLIVYGSGLFSANCLFLIGGIIFTLSFINRRITAYFLIGCFLTLFLFAPFIGFGVSFFRENLPLPLLKSLAPYEMWWSMVKTDSLRLITGYGFEASSGVFSFAHPILIKPWFDLGILGALAAALVACSITFNTLKERTLIMPSVFASLTTAFLCSLSGLIITQSWWLVTNAALILTFIAIQRSPFHTTRPSFNTLITKVKHKP